MVGTDFGMFDGICVDAENDFGLVFEFLEEFNFEIWIEARKGAGGVLVVDEFATEFEVEFVEHFDAFFDFFLLNFEIFVCIKTFFHVDLLYDNNYNYSTMGVL